MTAFGRLLVALAVATSISGAALVSGERECFAQSSVSKTSTVKVYVHMMPWFEDPSTSGNGMWGSHWTMSNQNPDIVDSSGRRQIASYYYPLIGPYGSSDRDVIEYQLLLMKYAGIDGLLIDWPGTVQAYDYPKNKQNAEAIMSMTSQMGLEFGIVYEDHNVGLAFNAHLISDEVGAAKNDMAYARDNYFGKPNYTKVNGAPLLLDFGPQTFTSSSDWDTIFSVFSAKPIFLTLWYQSNSAGANASGEFAWVAMDFTTGLNNFYQNRPLYVRFGCAYPGYNSFYAAGGWGTSSWTIPSNGTSTFSTTLNLATSNVSNVQIATWNDYGEGTMIEPTREFGYGLLTALQQGLGVVVYSDMEFQLIATLFQQRKQYAGDAAKQSQLDQASTDLANLAVCAAAAILGVPIGSSCGSTGGSSSGSTSGSGSAGSSGSGGGSSGSGGGSGGSSGTSSGSGASGSGAGSSGTSGGGSSSGTSGAAADGGGGSGSPAGDAGSGGGFQGGCACHAATAGSDGGAAAAALCGCLVVVLRRRGKRPRAA
jgi:hypothetical protein